MALIDPADLFRVGAWSWRARPKPNGVYAQAKVKGRTTQLARFIMESDAPAVDHRTGDTLDNRRANLREATATENARNRRKKRAGTSPYKGVHYAPKYAKRPWRATMRIDGVHRDLGCYATPEEAARAYDDTARHVHGDFARLNFPDEVA